jgi:hypothetical protein
MQLLLLRVELTMMAQLLLSAVVADSNNDTLGVLCAHAMANGSAAAAAIAAVSGCTQQYSAQAACTKRAQLLLLPLPYHYQYKCQCKYTTIAAATANSNNCS